MVADLTRRILELGREYRGLDERLRSDDPVKRLLKGHEIKGDLPENVVDLLSEYKMAVSGLSKLGIDVDTSLLELLEDYYKSVESIKVSHHRRSCRGCIDALVNGGGEFYSEQKDSRGNYIGVAVALQNAVDNMGFDRIIATMPLLIAGKARADKSNYLWQKWFTALSEENAGIDKNGKLVGRGQPVVLTLHGGGILTPERIRQAYSEGLTPQNAAKFTNPEFDNLLNGVLPSGESINLYTVDDVKRGIPDPFGKYAVWMPAETAKSKSSGYHTKSDFMNNELVIARAGTLEYLETYFEKAKHSDNTVGNWHRLGEIDYSQLQGRVLFLNNNYDGLDGNNCLNDDGRFVGVAAEPHA